MRFDFVPYGGSWMPLVPVVFGSGKRKLPPMGALVDTGATHSILPLEIAPELGIEIEAGDGVVMQVAGAGQLKMFPSQAPIDFVIRDPDSHMEHQWRGNVIFSLGQKLILLGHHQCLEKFDVTFRGSEKELEMGARLRTESIGRPKRSSDRRAVPTNIFVATDIGAANTFCYPVTRKIL
ncbi:MAG: hypothetical protein ACJ8C4_06705 [Gemmataceae bacterium]